MASHAVRSAAKIAGCGLLCTVGAYTKPPRSIEHLDSHSRPGSWTRPIDHPFRIEVCIESIYKDPFILAQFNGCKICFSQEATEAELDAQTENIEKMREEMRHAGPEKVAKWEQAGKAVQESMVEGSTLGKCWNTFDWPITEEYLDAALNNIAVMRDAVRRMEAAKRRNCQMGVI